MQEAVDVAKRFCERAAGARPCPRCGRLPSEAYASEFSAASLFVAAAGPLLGAAGPAMIVGLGVIWGLDEAKYVFWGAIIIFGAIAATAGALLARFVKRHIVFFRSPEANLKAIERANAAETKRKERRATRNNAGSAEETLYVDEAPSRSVGIDDMILGWFNASAPLVVEPSEIWGVCPERATSAELKGRLGFQALSAARIWAVGGWFLASAAASLGLVFPQAFRAAEPFFLASALIWSAPIGIPARLASAAGLEPSPLTFVLAAFAAAIAFRYVWARRVERIRFQGIDISDATGSVSTGTAKRKPRKNSIKKRLRKRDLNSLHCGRRNAESRRERSRFCARRAS